MNHHSSVGGHLGCFQVLAITNEGAVKSCIGFYVDINFHFSGKMHKCAIAFLMANICLVLNRNCQTTVEWLSAYIPTSNV